MELLVNTKISIEKQILETKEKSFIWVLTAQKFRLEDRVKDLKKYIDLIKVYISKIS
jgi:hypothetical protein